MLHTAWIQLLFILSVWIIKKLFCLLYRFWSWWFHRSKNNDKQMSPTYSIQKKILILPFILLVSHFNTVFLIWNNSFEMEYSNDKGRFQLMLKTHFEIHVEPFVCNNYFKKCSIFNSNWFHLSWFWFNMGLNGDGRTRCPQIHQPPVHQ